MAFWTRKTHTVTFDPKDLVVIRSYLLEVEAELARVVLEAAGIDCMLLRDSHSEHREPIRLAVRRGQAEEANKVLIAAAIG